MGADSEGEASVPETNIQDIPDECLVQILRCVGPVNFWREKLDHGMDVAVVRNASQCGLVCRRWRALADLGVDSLRLYERIDTPRLLEAFARWSCLKRLDLGRCWREYSQPSKPSAFQSSEQLRAVLHSASSVLPFLQHLRLEYNWKDLSDVCMQIYSLPHLTTLEIRCCRLPPLNDRSSEILHTLELVDVTVEELESLGLFTRLRSLSIEALNVSSLPTSMSQLSLLTRLNLDCRFLRELPDSIVQLTGLSYLRVRSTELRCPQSLWDLGALRTLILALTDPLPSQPPIDLHHLTRLKDLRLANVHYFEGLPENMGELQHLAELELSFGSRSLSEPSSSLIASDLSSLPETISRLSKLKIPSLERLPSSATLPEGLADCSSLTALTISRCDSLQHLPHGLGRLSLLKKMSIGKCPSLTSLPSSLGYLPMLRSLIISECNSLRELPRTLRGLTALEELHIHFCPSLVSLPDGLGALEKLQSLHISRCHLRELPEEIGNLKALEYLTISKCPSLLSLPPCIASRLVDINNCSSLVSLPPSLATRRLVISKCHALREIPESFSRQAPALKEIELNCLSGVFQLPSLCSFQSLKSLHVHGFPAVVGLPESLGELRALEELKVGKCSSLASLPESLGSLDKLTRLVIYSCPLRTLPESIGLLTSLETLKLWECILINLPRSLGRLTNLKNLYFRQTQKICLLPACVVDLGGGRVFQRV